MLAELVINEFAIIDQLHLKLQPGFNVLTGETGAGKSIILDAMALVLGDRADTTMIRTGSDSAYVEATFVISQDGPKSLANRLSREGLDSGDEYLTLARELRSNGRSISRISGKVVNLNILREVGELLVDIHGQGEHLTLLRPASHGPLLDAYGDTDARLQAIGKEVDKLSAVRSELASLKIDERELNQRRDLLSYQISEIAAAKLEAQEEGELKEERTRLANAESLIQHSNAVLRALEDSHESRSSVSDLLGEALQNLAQLSAMDQSLNGLHDQLNDLSFQLSDVTSELLSYQEKLEFNPRRLSFVEERLDLINGLKSKYGDSIQEILAWGEAADNELAKIEFSEEHTAELELLEERILHNVGSLAKELSDDRKKTADQLSMAVESELSELNMEKAKFGVDFSWTEDSGGVYIDQNRYSFNRTGVDSIEFMVSTNPGESLKPLAKVASGGETSRLMLALKSVLAQVDKTPTLIFDEIDQGIGGRIGDIVGHKLWRLTKSEKHQVIIVTHLPQMAGYAEGHFHVSKEIVDGRTLTKVSVLDSSSRLQELALMLGTEERSAADGAESILDRVQEVKTAQQ